MLRRTPVAPAQRREFPPAHWGPEGRGFPYPPVFGSPPDVFVNQHLNVCSLWLEFETELFLQRGEQGRFVGSAVGRIRVEFHREVKGVLQSGLVQHTTTGHVGDVPRQFIEVHATKRQYSSTQPCVACRNVVRPDWGGRRRRRRQPARCSRSDKCLAIQR